MIKKIIAGLLVATVVFAANEARFPKGIIGNLQGTATSITGVLIPGNVPNNFITNAQLQNMPAHTIKGNNTGSSGSPQDLTATQATAELNPFVGDTGFGGTKGLVPAPAIGDATKCLGGNGLWTTCGGGGGGGSGTASKYEQLEQKNQIEHYGIVTDPLDQALGTGFQDATSSYYLQGVLMDSVVAGSGTIIPVYNPIPLVPSDVNLDSTTGWAPLVGTSSVATNATHKVGNLSLRFAENVGQPRALIFYDHGSETLNVNGSSDHYVWVNLSSATGVTAIKIEIGDIGGTSSICVSCTQQWLVPTQADGSALQAGWNLIHQDVRQGGTALGAGWPSTRPFRYYAIGSETPGMANNPVVMIDGPYFSIDDAIRYIPKGAEVSIYDNLHRENTVLAASNNAVAGPLNALNNFTYSYTPGIGGATVARSTLLVGGGKAALTTTDQFGNAVAGDAQLTQESRITKIFRAALSAVDLHASFDVDTPQIYRIGATTGASIYIDDPSDSRLDLKNGETIHIFATNYSDGRAYWSKRCDVAMTADSTPIVLGSTTGLVAVPCAGAQAGDYAAKKHLTANFQVGAIGVNETFATPFSTPSVPDDVILYDDGLPLPHPESVAAYYTLGFPRPQKNRVGYLPDLTLAGTLIQNAPFKQGLLGSTGWSSSNYYESVGSATQITGQTVMSVSIWYKPPASIQNGIVAGNYTGSANGWYINEDGSGRVQVNVNNTTYLDAGPSIADGKFHHIVWNFNNGGGQVFVDSILVSSAAAATVGTPNSTGAGLRIGNPNVPLDGSAVVAQAVVWVGKNLTADEVSSIYNSGLGRKLGFGPVLKYRYDALGTNGQACTLKGQIRRDTTNVNPSIGKMGISP